MVDSSTHSIGAVPVQFVPLQANHPSLFDLWTMYQFRCGTLALLAKVSLSTVQAMLYNQPVQRQEAQQVLAQLSTLLHKPLTLSTVYVALIEEEREVSYG